MSKKKKKNQPSATKKRKKKLNQRASIRSKKSSKETHTSLSNASMSSSLNVDLDPLSSDQPLLTMAMMVKNEEEFLHDALQSVVGLADELVVVDTGSTDRTVEIAQSFGANISYYPWQDDFSEARNETIRRSKGKWVLILDADERVVIKPQHIHKFREGLKKFYEEAPYVGISISVINIRLDGSEMNSLPSVRVFPNTMKLRYQNRVHNQLITEDKDVEMNIKQCDFLSINHLGYDPIIYEKRKKSDRSLPLIQKMLEDEPDNMVYRFYEGREYLIKKQYSEAVHSLELAVLGILEGKHGYFVETLKTLLSTYDYVDFDPERIMTFCDLGIEKHPDQPDFWYFKAQNLRDLKQYPQAIEHYQESIKRMQVFTLSEVSQSHPIMSQVLWRANQVIGELYWELEQYQDSYNYLKIALQDKPLKSERWPQLLNSLCALAIEFDDQENQLSFFERLLLHSKTSLDMFFFQVETLQSKGLIEEARTLLQWGRKKSSRVKKSPTFQILKDTLNL